MVRNTVLRWQLHRNVHDRSHKKMLRKHAISFPWWSASALQRILTLFIECGIVYTIILVS
jgi:hypothetical protein